MKDNGELHQEQAEQVVNEAVEQVTERKEGQSEEIEKDAEKEMTAENEQESEKEKASENAKTSEKDMIEAAVEKAPPSEKTKIPLAGSKWSKWRLVHDVEALSDCQPLTCPYTPEYLKRFLDRFESVFLKPDEGYGGTDVIRVKRDGETLQALRESELHTFATLESFDAWLSDIRKDRTFLVQQGIDLLPYKGRLVDLRTILFKTPSGRWCVTGMFAKAAKPGMAVTNVKAGGHPFRVDKYIRRLDFDPAEKKRIERELITLSLAVANVFEQHYANTLYGLDIGIDRAGKLWLIEVNTKPSILILREIDRKMFLRSARLRWPQKFRRR